MCESGPKWAVQKGECGRAFKVVGRAKVDSLEPKWKVTGSRRSFDKKWTVLWDKSKCQSGRSESVKLEYPKLLN